MRNRHIDHEFQVALNTLRQKLSEMFMLAEAMFGACIESLKETGREAGAQVRHDEDGLDRLEEEIDELCLNILALRNPVASDLRFVAACLKMITDLERIGDLAVNVVERRDQILIGGPPIVQDSVARMVQELYGMFADTKTSLRNIDCRLAREVISRDEVIDTLCTSLFRETVSSVVDGSLDARAAAGFQSTAKYIERIADHLVNVCEQVLFIEEGTKG